MSTRRRSHAAAGRSRRAIWRWLCPTCEGAVAGGDGTLGSGSFCVVRCGGEMGRRRPTELLSSPDLVRVSSSPGGAHGTGVHGLSPPAAEGAVCCRPGASADVWPSMPGYSRRGASAAPLERDARRRSSRRETLQWFSYTSAIGLEVAPNCLLTPRSSRQPDIRP
jgi:hypothetical protein